MRRYVLPAAILVAIATFRIVSTYGVLSHTMDEPTHLGAGMEWLDHGTYAGDTSHPPLARVLSAAAVYLDGARYIPADSALDEGLKLLGRDAHYDRVLSLARMGILPFFWLASAAVFWWAWRVGGGMAAVAATLLFTTTPPVLAHAGLVTTDMAATAMCTIAALASLAWAKRPDVARSVALGISLGLGVIAKFSFIVFLPAFWALMLLWKRPAFSEMLRYVRPAMGALLLGCVVIWAGYGFTFGAVEPLGWTLPAPPLWDGLRLLLKHNTEGHSSYILGEQHHNGVWYFFPVILAVKTPLGFLLLLPWALWVARRERIGIAAPLLFSAGILAVAMTSRINIGVRHVLPIYVGLAVICGTAAAWLLRPGPGKWARLSPVLVFALFAWHVGSGALAHPDYIPYTNEIAGTRPEAFVAESDLDWGQDMHRVGSFLRRAGATEVSFTPYSQHYVQAGHAFPTCHFSDWYKPAPGWNVISLGGLKVYNHPGWVGSRQPQFRIGLTHWAWYFPPGKL